jgi:hypothetical protein
MNSYLVPQPAHPCSKSSCCIIHVTVDKMGMFRECAHARACVIMQQFLKSILNFLRALKKYGPLRQMKLGTNTLQYSETSINCFCWGLKKKQWIRENNRCGSHNWNRIRSGTLEIEWRIRENELSGNDRQRFHCICTFFKIQEKHIFHLPHISK